MLPWQGEHIFQGDAVRYRRMAGSPGTDKRLPFIVAFLEGEGQVGNITGFGGLQQFVYLP
jgi:hypothetical protein